MSSSSSGTESGSRFFVLALGLLVGFVIGFVMLLSRLPMDTTLSDFALSENRPELLVNDNYQFYSRLEDQTIQQRERVVSYAEIPASNLGQESYYLQAGNFRRSSEAEQTRAAVLLLGLEAFIVVRRDSDGETGHRVRIGPFFDQAKVSSAKERLQRGGINYKLIRVTG